MMPNRWLGWGLATGSPQLMAMSDTVVGSQDPGTVRRYLLTGRSLNTPLAVSGDELTNQMVSTDSTGSMMSFTRPLVTSAGSAAL